MPKPVSPDEAVSPGPLLPALVSSGYVYFIGLAWPRTLTGWHRDSGGEGREAQC